MQKGIAKYPKDWRFYKAGLMLADGKKDPAEAKRMLTAGLEALPRDVQLLYLAFDRQIRDRDFEAARDTLKKLTYYGIRPGVARLFAGAAPSGRRQNAGGQSNS